MTTADATHVNRRRWRLQVTGTVQGVGFRPFVYRLAQRLGLAGWVANTAQGVIIEAEGEASALARLRAELRQHPPAAARVVAITTQSIPPTASHGFAVRESVDAGPRSVPMPADLATCEACLAELFDPGDRRYRYPFINCTDCGPRYSLIEGLPYDRERTTMRHFTLCGACRREYQDPANRRFHAEPNACPACGPRLSLWNAHGSERAHGERALGEAVELLHAGRIIALKSLGGFQLLVDARNPDAVQRLRARKARPDKPLAVMFPTLAAVDAACRLAPAERELLNSSKRPIVLVPAEMAAMAANVAPNSPRLGVMLPFTPLHHLLLDALHCPVVATSGNRAGEPIAMDETQALDRLAGIADAFLVHDRRIARPVDDSVVRVVAGREMVLRRARGFSPSLPLDLPSGLLALGGHLKSTVALSAAGQVILSQHLGDLDTPQARENYRRVLEDLPALYGTEPSALACDCHPDYHSSHVAQRRKLPVARVPHHLAHVLAGAAEDGLATPLLGVAWDGSGHGEDGRVWGGEFLRLDGDGYQRVAHLRPFALPGGEAAVREPRRCAFGLLARLFGDEVLSMTDLDGINAFTRAERETLMRLIRRGINAPETTSAGRLFDAVAALLGLRQRSSFEGQAAMALEWAADGARTQQAYEFPLLQGASCGVIDWEPALRTLLDDRAAGRPLADMAAAFHHGLAAAIVSVAERVGERRVVLGGGCFQNARLTETAVRRLTAAGFDPHWPSQIPPNDGGLALGQLAWAGRMLPCA